MNTLKTGLRVLVAAGACLASVVHAQAPPSYPAAYQTVIDDARKEGKLIIYAATDTSVIRPLLKDFEALYGIKVEYNDMNSTELYNRIISEAAAGSGSGDFLWSSAMDLQIKLANDNIALQRKQLTSMRTFQAQQAVKSQELATEIQRQ